MTEPADDALSPLDVLLRAMRAKLTANDHEGAARLAALAAPYVHPRARPAPPLKAPREMEDQELFSWIAAADAAQQQQR